jgi:hypothetical protein
MPYCTGCGDEFQKWVKTCPDCGLALVDKLPRPSEQERLAEQRRRERRKEPIVHVATAPNESVARFWAGILEDNGIRCLVRSTGLRPAAYVLPHSLQCTMHVLASEAERASQILSALPER